MVVNGNRLRGSMAFYSSCNPWHIPQPQSDMTLIYPGVGSRQTQYSDYASNVSFMKLAANSLIFILLWII